MRHRSATCLCVQMVVVSVTGGCGAKGEVIDGFDAGANARYLHSCQWQTGRGQDKDKCVCVCVCVCVVIVVV